MGLLFGKEVNIIEVWADNLKTEMGKIREVVEKYKYIAMDTEFPGVVARPIGSFTTTDYHYQTLRVNVDLLRIIQLGITFTDENGVYPQNCTWQFNFKFNLNEDTYAPDSIDLLIRSGIDFNKMDRIGIDVFDFGELLISSGLVLNEDIKWISFHSGYDFGYLLKVLTQKPLPAQESEFADLLKQYFNEIYDIKFLMKSCKSLKGGLNDLAEDLKVDRIGPKHQAGSDSLLTASTFFKMRQMFFDNKIDSKFSGALYGLSEQSSSSVTTTTSTPYTPSNAYFGSGLISQSKNEE